MSDSLEKKIKKNPPQHHLNCELTSLYQMPLGKVRAHLKEKKVKRSTEEEVAIERRWLETRYLDQELSFRGFFDGITHYLIWILVFIMPIFIPYFENYSITRGTKNPGLLQTAIIYIILAPIMAAMIYKLTKYFQKRQSLLVEKLFLGTITSCFVWGFYMLLCHLGFLPNALFYSTTVEPMTVWFSSFSNGKFFFTYASIIIITIFFLIQQRTNRDHLVIRFPLKKIIFCFFIVHLIAMFQPITNPENSLLNEALMRLHQWIQYFLLFIILVNVINSLGQLLSIVKASSISGTLVALIGIGQEFFTSTNEKFISITAGIKKVTSTFVMYNPAEHQPFSTFGHNNFAAAYVCLATPVTLSIVGSLLTSPNKKTHKASYRFQLIFFFSSLLIQFLYLTISLGKAGIVSTAIALFLCLIFSYFLIPISKRKALSKGIVITLVSLSILSVLSVITLHKIPATSSKIEKISDKWNEKISKSFDLKQGSNRVRLSYVGGALSLSRFSFTHMLTGVGPNNYKYHYPLIRDTEEANLEKGKHVLQAHSDFAQFAADLGIVGFMIFGLLIIYPIYAGGRLLIQEENFQRRLIGLGFLCTLISMAINSFFFFPFQTPGSLLPYFISLGLLFSYEKKNIIDFKAAKLTFITLAILSIALYSYEAWYFCLYDSNSLINRLTQNTCLILSALAIILAGHYFLHHKKQHFNVYLVLPNNIFIITLLFGFYLGFSYLFSFSYIYTDYIRQAFMQQKAEDLRVACLRLKEDPNTWKPVLKASYHKFDQIFNEIHQLRNQAVLINPNNPDVYYLMSQTITFQMNLFNYAFLDKNNELNPEIPSSVWSLGELQEFYIREAHAGDATWPNNRDQYYQLSKGYLNYAYAFKDDFEKFSECLLLAQKYAQKALDIWPNDLDVMECFLISSQHLNAINHVQEYYRDEMKNNWFINGEINYMLSEYFDKNNLKDLSLEIQIKNFISYPKYQGPIKKLHERLKEEKSFNGELKYPRGVIDLLEEVRFDGKTVIQNFLTNRHQYVSHKSYEYLMALFIEYQLYDYALQLQNFFLTLKIGEMDINNELLFRENIPDSPRLSETIIHLGETSQRFVNRSKNINNWKTALFVIKAFSGSANNSLHVIAKKIFESYICHNFYDLVKKYDEFNSLYNQLYQNSNFNTYLKNLYLWQKIKLDTIQLKEDAKKYFSKL